MYTKILFHTLHTALAPGALLLNCPIYRVGTPKKGAPHCVSEATLDQPERSGCRNRGFGTPHTRHGLPHGALQSIGDVSATMKSRNTRFLPSSTKNLGDGNWMCVCVLFAEFKKLLGNSKSILRFRMWFGSTRTRVLDLHPFQRHYTKAYQESMRYATQTWKSYLFPSFSIKLRPNEIGHFVRTSCPQARN